MRVAVVLAGGSGQRSGVDTNKVLVDLAGIPVIRRSVEAMLAGGADAVVVVSRPREHAAVSAALAGIDHVITDGGDTRQRSEAAGVAAAAALGATTSTDVIAVHDAARPLVSPRLVAAVFAAAATGVAYPATEGHDLWRADADGRPLSAVNGPLLAAQTPQGARADLLIDAVRNGGEAAADAPDTVDVMQRFSPSEPAIVVVAGEATNIKVTWPDDFGTAERLLASAVGNDAPPPDDLPIQSGLVDDEFAVLTEVEGQVADAKIALDCLAAEGTDICATCQAAEADGTLADRPALARCVAAKRA